MVNMIPVSNSIDTTHPGIPVIYPNPASTEIKAVLPDQILGSVNIRIISISGSLISDYDVDVVPGYAGSY